MADHMPLPREPSDLICEELETVGSTNDYLKPFVDDGAWRRVTAREQTQGRGRYGRHWHSAPDEGLYASFLTYPSFGVEDARLLHEISSLAVVEAIEALGRPVQCRVKKPNDVLIGRRKVAGILIEIGSTEQRLSWCVVGIGVNLSQRRFPPELEGRATSLHREGLLEIDPRRFCDSLTRKLLSGLEQAAAGDRDDLRVRYQQRLR